MNEHLETGQVLAASALPGQYRLLRIAAPFCAEHIRPGQFIHINARPLAVMRASSSQGWLECLQRGDWNLNSGTPVEVIGPLGDGFDVDAATPRALLLGDQSGLAPLVFLANLLGRRQPRVRPLLLLSAAQSLPFEPWPSTIIVPGLPAWVIAAIPLLEDWNIPSRLASTEGWPGCFDGPLEELARGWLDSLQGAADVTVYACGTEDLRAAARRLAEDYRLPCQSVAAPPETSS